MQDRDELKIIRRYLHQHPELSFQEYNTQKYIISFFDKMNCKIYKVKTGVLIYFDFHKKDIIAFRAEEDALNIEETNDINYKSLNKGISHACGHDGHMAILMMLGKYINSHYLENNYLLIFQPSEEKNGGSRCIIESEFFKTHKIKYIFALHLYPTLKEGIIYSKSKEFLPMCVEIDIKIKSFFTHVGNRNYLYDCNYILSLIMKDLYQHFNKKIFNIGYIQGGVARNIVCGETTLLITLRNYKYEDYLKQKEIIINILKKYSTVKINYRFNDDFLPVYNDEKLLKRIGKMYHVELTNKKTIGDDFSLYNLIGTTNYSLLGVKSAFLHQSDFDFNDDVLLVGLNYFISLLNIK